MKKYLFVLALFASAFFAFAQQSLETLLSADVVKTLRDKGSIQNVVYGEPYTPHLYPDTDLAKATATRWQTSGKTNEPTFSYEALFLLQKQNPTEAGADIEQISKIMRSISKLEGIQYYSNSRKKYREMYKLSYCIDAPDTKVKIADPIDGSADGLSIYALQEDSTFGKFVYQYNFRQTENELMVNSCNIDALSLIGIKIIKPNDFHYSILLHDAGDAIMMYALIQTDVISLSMIEEKLKVSFAARVEALKDWFYGEYRKIDENRLGNVNARAQDIN